MAASLKEFDDPVKFLDNLQKVVYTVVINCLNKVEFGGKHSTGLGPYLCPFSTSSVIMEIHLGPCTGRKKNI